MSITHIPLSVPCLSGNEQKYINECITTGWVSSVGSFVDRFEQSVANIANVPFGVAAVNGTSALHVALLVAGVEADHEVLVPTITFIASANSVRYVNAWPVFIDIEPDYLQMDPRLVEKFLRENCYFENGNLRNRKSNRIIKAMMVVHVLGHPTDMTSLLKLAEEFGLKIIEDASESIGSEWQERPTGGIGHIGCFSFNGNKIVTAGGGGAIVTSDPEWAKKAKYLTTQAKDDELEYIHGEIGFNYRLTNIQAAVGLAQMEQLMKFIDMKRKITREYNERLADLPGVILPKESQNCFSNCWLYTLRVGKKFGLESRELIKELGQRRIQARPLWQPMHLSKPHQASEYFGGKVSEIIHEEAVSLPCSVNLTEEQQETVIQAICQIQKNH